VVDLFIRGNLRPALGPTRQAAPLPRPDVRLHQPRLGATGKHYTLTNDIPGGNVNSAGSWQLRNVAQIVDWIDLMSFDTR
jgi:hypothetical protein